MFHLPHPISFIQNQSVWIVLQDLVPTLFTRCSNILNVYNMAMEHIESHRCPRWGEGEGGPSIVSESRLGRDESVHRHVGSRRSNE
jgi:hypothetical protein